MNTIYLTIRGVKLSLHIFNETQQKTIFFIHGNSSSSNVWRKQVVSKLLQDYRLVTIDLPNHGGSDELSETSDFSIPAIGRIISEAIGIMSQHQPYIICSLSLGTNIVSEMMISDLLPMGLFFAGPCIVGKEFEMDKMMRQDADLSVVFTDIVADDKVRQYASCVSTSDNIEDIEIFLEDFSKVKGQFRSSFYATIAAGAFNDEIEILRKKGITIAIVFGKEEKIVNTGYLDKVTFPLWTKVTYKIPGASHLVNVDNPEKFNELLLAFVKDVIL